MRCIPHKTLVADHILDEVWLDMRDNRFEVMWVKALNSVGEKTPDCVEFKGIYRARVRAES
jgi:hypothetical protein